MADIIVSKQDANQILRLAFDDDTQALRTTASALAEQTVVQPDGSQLHVTVDESALPTGAATEATLSDVASDTATIQSAIANIDQPISPNVMQVAGTDGSDARMLKTSATGELQIDVITSVLPADAATETTLSSIDTKTPALVTGRVPVDGSGVTQPVSAASLPLPTGASTEATLAAFSAKSAGALVPEAFDYQSITYVTVGNGIGEIETVVYKTGGSGGTTVATLTMAYDANDRLSTVTRT